MSVTAVTAMAAAAAIYLPLPDGGPPVPGPDGDDLVGSDDFVR